ncbi:MAG: energy transducer TonB [Novosphingobium sp.]
MSIVFLRTALAFAQVAGNLVPPVPSPPPVNVITMPRGPNLPAQPQSAPGSWINSFDYPSKALREELTGAVLAELHVNRWGSVADCVIVGSSGHAILDEETCRLVVRRARFFPATDASGKAIAGTATLRFVWALPDGPAPQGQTQYRIATDGYPRGPRLENPDWSVLRAGDYPADALARKSEGPSLIALDIDAAGKVTGCSVRQSSGDPVLDQAACKLAMQRARFVPGADVAGRNAAGRALTGVDWRLSAISDRPVSPPRVAVSPTIPFRRPGVATISFDAHADGTVSNCQSTGDRLDGMGRQFFAMCDLAQRYPAFKYEPLVDAASNPVDARVTVKYAIEVAEKPKTPGK